MLKFLATKCLLLLKVSNSEIVREIAFVQYNANFTDARKLEL